MKTLIVHLPSGKESFTDKDYSFTTNPLTHVIEIIDKNAPTNFRTIHNATYETVHSEDAKPETT